MVDIMRHRHSDAKRVKRHPVDSATVIEIGDQLWLDTDDAKPASDFTYVTGDLAATQANFAARFVGIAMEASADGDTEDISVAAAGAYEMDCAAAQFEVGDLLGVDDNAGGTALVDQQVIAVGENGYGGIFRAAKRYSANTTRVVAEIVPWFMGPSDAQYVNLGTHDITSAADIVTDLAIQFPFKLVAVNTIVATALTGQSVLTVDKGATSLDDTHAITSGGAVGVHDRSAMDDATGDDIFLAGDTLSVASDGGATAGEVAVILEIKPFNIER